MTIRMNSLWIRRNFRLVCLLSLLFIPGGVHSLIALRSPRPESKFCLAHPSIENVEGEGVMEGLGDIDGLTEIERVGEVVADGNVLVEAMGQESSKVSMMEMLMDSEKR